MGNLPVSVRSTRLRRSYARVRPARIPRTSWVSEPRAAQDRAPGSHPSTRSRTGSAWPRHIFFVRARERRRPPLRARRRGSTKRSWCCLVMRRASQSACRADERGSSPLRGVRVCSSAGRALRLQRGGRGSTPLGSNPSLTTRSLWRRALVCNTGRGGFDSHSRLSCARAHTCLQLDCPRSSTGKSASLRSWVMWKFDSSRGRHVATRVFVVKGRSHVSPKDGLLVRVQPKTLSLGPWVAVASHTGSRDGSIPSRGTLVVFPLDVRPRGVAQGKRARFGSERSWVRSPPPRCLVWFVCTRSSAGRAAVLQAAGRGFDPLPVHFSLRWFPSRWRNWQPRRSQKSVVLVP